MRKLRFPAGAVSAAVAMSLMLATPSWAQSLDEITVVARKTEENLQEVPLAINAIGSEEITRLGVQDLADLAQQDTSVQFDEGFTPSDTRITIRGLSPTRGRPNAAALIDGIDITSEAVSNAGGSLLIDPSIVDAQRVEIVKGPQSALYGRSAFAGAILYVSKDPADTFSGGVGLDYNLQGDEQITGNISLPVSETLGIRINGRAFNSDGYYRNAATNELLGGGDGAGIALTLKWEPTDNVSMKWRTDYSDDQFDVVPQVLLNDFNQLYDLGNSGGLGPERSNIAPLSGLRPALPGEMPDRAGCAGGFLDNYSCGDGAVFNEYLTSGAAGDPFFPANNPPGFGTYDPNDPLSRNIYNKQVVSLFAGKLPDTKGLQASVNPDYRKVSNPILAEDFEGTQRIVFRNSLVINWDITDRLAFASYSAFTDAKERTATDIGKFFRDECRPGPNPAGLAPEFVAQSDCTGGDGIHDGPILFLQDSDTETKQLSQEFRLTFDIREDLQFTQGLQFWQEKVQQVQFNNSTITGGPVCYLGDVFTNPGVISDLALNPASAGFLGLDASLQCGNSALPAAYWADDTLANRPPDDIRRRTDHYSWYGQVKWDITEKLRATFEARFTREDNQVTGPTQFRCLNGLADEFFSDPQRFRDSATGRELCQGFITDPNTGEFFNAPGSESAATTGPGTVILCGQIGRCESLSDQPGNTFWDYGFAPQPGYAQTLDRTDRYWAPKATIEYYWTDEIMTYFSWSRGIKPGGFSLITLGAFGIDANNDGNTDEIEFEEERLDVWEIGFKTDLFDNRVRWNGAMYYQDFKDKQVTQQEVIGQTIGTRVANIDGSEVLGFETDVAFQATDNLLVSFSYTFLDSEYTDYEFLTRSANDIARGELGPGQGCVRLETFEGSDDLGCLVSLTGNELERAPRHSFSADATYTNSFFDTGYDWFGTVNFRYQDSRWLEQWNIVEMPEYMRTNVSLGITADRWDLQLYVENLFDDDTPITGGANPGIPTGSFGFGFESFFGIPPGINAGPKLPNDVYLNLPDPRLVGARINFRFGE